MTDELKPCPFCGSKGEAYRTINGTYSCSCTSCSYASCAGFKTLEESIEAWNKRAERTCRMTKKGPEFVLAGWWECSECGPVYPPCNDEIAVWALQKCPRCGAKVVEI